MAAQRLEEEVGGEEDLVFDAVAEDGAGVFAVDPGDAEGGGPVEAGVRG